MNVVFCRILAQRDADGSPRKPIIQPDCPQDVRDLRFHAIAGRASGDANTHEIEPVQKYLPAHTRKRQAEKTWQLIGTVSPELQPGVP